MHQVVQGNPRATNHKGGGIVVEVPMHVTSALQRGLSNTVE